MIAGAFFVLAAYVGIRSADDLVTAAQPEESVPSMVLAAVSVVVMPAKAGGGRAARQRSLKADSKRTTLCTYLSVFLLFGLGSNALFGWWWADPVARVAIAAVAADEGRELWRTEDFCCR